ncbi:MAG: dual specificity protein phosphatase family protein [Planctomycetota bacterium]|nr:dual specificity protein phosphatase family protein [Planctomycetota bacterium]
MRWLIARVLFYPTLAWNLLLKSANPRRRWWDRVDEHVLIGALPFEGDVDALHAEGVRAVVNTCEEYAGPGKAYARLGIAQLRIPTVDFTPPALEDIERAVSFMKERAARGESVLVHCKAGRGRSATVVVCWLIERAGLTPGAAMDLLAEKRPHVMRAVARREVVRAFAEKRGLRGS